MVTIYEEGIQEGRQKRTLEIIAKNLEKGKSHEEIRDILFLTENEYQEFLKMLENPDDSTDSQKAE